MGEAGIEVPEFRCPTTPTTLLSTSFCATVVPTFGSAWSSSATSVNLTLLPSILMPAALASSMASRAPFSLSLPRWAMPPASGATWPILTSSSPAGAAAGAALLSAFGAVCSCLPHAASANAAATRVMVALLFMASPGKCARKCAGKSARLFLRQHPLHQRLDVGVGNVAVRRHRHGAPDAGAAFLDLLEELRLRVLLPAVFRGDVLVGGPDQLLVHRVTGE